MLRVHNSNTLTINSAKFSGYYFNINTNIQGDFQISISVLLILSKVSVITSYGSSQNFASNIMRIKVN